MMETTNKRRLTMSRIKNLVIGALMAGALIVSSGCVVADSPWHSYGRDRPNFGRLDRSELRADYARLEQPGRGSPTTCATTLADIA